MPPARLAVRRLSSNTFRIMPDSGGQTATTARIARRISPSGTEGMPAAEASGAFEAYGTWPEGDMRAPEGWDGAAPPGIGHPSGARRDRRLRVAPARIDRVLLRPGARVDRPGGRERDKLRPATPIFGQESARGEARAKPDLARAATGLRSSQAQPQSGEARGGR